jgi:hypothetical protein
MAAEIASQMGNMNLGSESAEQLAARLGVANVQRTDTTPSSSTFREINRPARDTRPQTEVPDGFSNYLLS